MRYIILLLALFVLVTGVFAQTTKVYPNGTVDVVVPAAQYVNVFTGGSGVTVVKKQVGGPSSNMALRFAVETGSPVTNQETVFGPYTLGTTLRIEAGPDGAFYSLSVAGAATNCLQQMPRPAYTQLAPATYNTTSTLLATDMMGGIITSTQSTGATISVTVSSGTLTDAAAGLSIGQAFPWTLINLSTSAANTVTLVAGTGHTIVGDTITQCSALTTGCSTSRWLTRKTAANTFVTYRQ